MTDVKIDYNYRQLHGQTKGYLLACKAIERSGMDDEFIAATRALDAASTHTLPDGTYIQLVFYGNKRIPFSILLPYTTQDFNFYHDHRHEVFDIVIANQPQPFGKDMYRCKE